jgi:hypothetical protein
MRVAHHEGWDIVFDETEQGKTIFERLFVNDNMNFILIFPNQHDINMQDFDQCPDISRIICKELIDIFEESDVYCSSRQPEDDALSLESVDVKVVVANCPHLPPFDSEGNFFRIIGKLFAVKNVLHYQYSNQNYVINVRPKCKIITIDTRRVSEQIRTDILAVLGQASNVFHHIGAQKVRFVRPRVYLYGEDPEVRRIQKLWERFMLFDEEKSTQKKISRSSGVRFSPDDVFSPVHELTITPTKAEKDTLTSLIQSSDLVPEVKFTGSAQEVEVVLALICLRYGLVKGET